MSGLREEIRVMVHGWFFSETGAGDITEEELADLEGYVLMLVERERQAAYSEGVETLEGK